MEVGEFTEIFHRALTQIIYKLSSSELLSSDFFIGSVAAPSSIPSETSAIIKQIQDVPINERFLL